jgi:serine/threonine-protein kinase
MPPPPAKPPLGQGTVVNDRYEIRQSLGKGGMGEVFLAYDRTTQQPIALKIVREEARMPGDDEALRQELLLARSVSHPNVCRGRPVAMYETMSAFSMGGSEESVSDRSS